MKKKICFLIYDLRIGGAEKIVSELSNSLCNINDYEITILTISNNNEYKDILINSIKLSSLNKKRILSSIFSLYYFIKINKFHIVFSNVWPITIISSLICLFLKKTNSVIIEHSLLIDQFKSNSNFISKYFKYLSVLIFYNLSNKIVAVSKITKKNLINLGVNNKKITIIYNFVNNKYDYKKDTNSSDIFFKNHDCLKLLNIGSFKKLKNQNFLIDVAYLLLNKFKINFVLLLVGNGPLKENIIEKIKKFKLESHVKICNSSNNLHHTYKNCDIYISSSLSESFGLSILEALSQNKKVVLSDIESSQEIIIKEHKVFLCTLNAELYANKIINISKINFSNIDKIYSKKFNIKESTDKYKKLIHSI